MSNAPVSYLPTLPVELLHRILDNLDALTIISSLRLTCRRLKSIVDNYDRYRLDFRDVSKSNFQLLCRLIDPRRVIALVLAPRPETTDEIELFTTYFRARQFKRLRSLDLINIKQRQLKNLFKRFDCSSLVSFSFTLGQEDCRCKNTTTALLSSITAQKNLRYLDMDVSFYDADQIIWSTQCAIKYLKLKGSQPLNEIFTILRCSLHLRVLDIELFGSVHDIMPLTSYSSMSFPQVISLTLSKMYGTIDNLELFILLMPSLNHLKIVSSKNFIHDNRWEQFIQANLPQLNRFELFIKDYNSRNTPVDLKSILAPFQTPFWIEHKKWFFTCEYSTTKPAYFILYSHPICVSSIDYIPESNKTSLSTLDPALNNNASSMNNVNTIQVSFEKFTMHDINQSLEVTIYHKFLLCI